MKEVKVLVLVSWESGTTIVVNDGSRLRRLDEGWDELIPMMARPHQDKYVIRFCEFGKTAGEYRRKGFWRLWSPREDVDELWDEFEQLWAVSNDWEKFPELYMEM